MLFNDDSIDYIRCYLSNFVERGGCFGNLGGSISLAELLIWGLESINSTRTPLLLSPPFLTRRVFSNHIHRVFSAEFEDFNAKPLASHKNKEQEERFEV